MSASQQTNLLCLFIDLTKRDNQSALYHRVRVITIQIVSVVLMGAKKKTEVHHPPPPPPVERPANTVITVKTPGGGEFKLSEEVIREHSSKMKSLLDHSKNDTITVQDASPETFSIVAEYLNLHKEKEPAKISAPIKTNQGLKYIMQEEDAALIDKVMEKGEEFLLQVMDLASVLEVHSLSRRLACGVAVKLTQSTLEDLEEEYQLESQPISNQELKADLKPMLDHLKHILDETD